MFIVYTLSKSLLPYWFEAVIDTLQVVPISSLLSVANVIIPVVGSILIIEV